MESVGFLSMGGYSMSLVLTREALSNQIATDLATRNTNAGLIEGAVDGAVVRIDTAESDIATLESDLGLVEIDVATLNGEDTVDGSVAKSVKDAIAPVSTSLDAVKVKTTENDLAIQDIRRDQTLANQSEAKISVADYGIVALPKNATGNLKMKREGLTARNLVTNGDFSNGTTGFTPLGATLSVTNKIMTCTATGAGNVGIFQAISAVNGSRFYTARARITAGSATALNCNYGGGGTAISSPVVGTWYTILSLIGSPLADQFYVYASGGSADCVVEIDGNHGCVAINTTANGDTETNTTILAQKYPYFADTKNVPFTGRYRGRGKNLFDKNEYKNLRTQYDFIGTTGYSTKVIQLVPNTTYRITGYGVANATTIILLNVLAQVNGAGYFDFRIADTKTFTTLSDGKLYIGVNTSNTDAQVNARLEELSVQLELGSTATTYAPFEAHDLYLSAPEGRSVPSAKDSVEVQDGRLVHVKRVSDEVTIAPTDIIGLHTYGTLFKFASILIAKFAGILPASSPSGNISGEDDALRAYYNRYVAGFSPDSQKLHDIVYNSTWSSGTVFVAIPLATADVAEARIYLTGLKIRYTLNTPITTPIDSDGAIPAGASVYWEPAIPDVGIYTTKFDIFDTDHQISSIDKLYKVDFATGVQTLLTDAVVAGDGLSFTSASLTDGDLVNVIYFYSVANPEGLTTITYLNSNLVIADTANGKYYTQKPKITNGVIQPLADWTLTEVV